MRISRYTTNILVIALALIAFLLPTMLIERYVLQHTGGVFSYPLDDSFIHLAIAKTLAFDHVWGISNHEFASASSSIFYPLVLAVAFFIFGAHTMIGFIVNFLAGVLLLIVVQRWLIRQRIKPLGQLVILLAVIALTPLPVIVICGMEHTLQLLFCFLFITRWSGEWTAMLKATAQGTPAPKDFSAGLYIYGALFVATRYEDTVVVAMACLIMLLHRKSMLSFQVALVSLSPILIFGIVAMYKGSYFFPNSVLLKSSAPPLTFNGLYEFFTKELPAKFSYSIAGYNTVSVQRLLFLLPLAYLLFARQLKEAVQYRYQLVLLISAVLVHLAFAGYVHFPRYEAYLIGCSVAIIGTLIVKYGLELSSNSSAVVRWVAILAGSLILTPLATRSKDAFRDIGQACINIYEQQYQMAQYLHKYYNKVAVAVGDIGAVSYFTEGKKVDLVGLANIDVARSKKEHYYSPYFLDKLSKHEQVLICICYDVYTFPDLVRRWTKVATWTIPNNVTCGDATVSIYSVEPTVTEGVARTLHDFQPWLPRDVIVRYYYAPPSTSSYQVPTYLVPSLRTLTNGYF